MHTPPAGVVFALSTAALWSVSPLFMASAGRRIGAYPVNLLRIGLSATFLCVVLLPAYALARGGVGVPTGNQLGWLVVSGLAGMVVGDLFFYEALVRLGPRRAIKMNTLAPVASLAAGWLWQGETLTPRALTGVAMVLGAIAYATFAEVGARMKDGEEADPPPSREPGGVTAAGVACGVGSAVCTGLGAVLTRQAFKQTTPLALDQIVATTIRVSSAAVLLWVLPVLTGRAAGVVGHLKDPFLRRRLLAGTALGPLGGMLCYVAAIKNAPAGLVSTLVATSPLVVIPVVALRYRVRIPPGVILASAVAVAGVGLISWGR